MAAKQSNGEKARLEHLARVESAMARVASTDDGIIVLKHLFHECGYDKYQASLDDKLEVKPYSTIFNLGMRECWVRLRMFIPPKFRSLIEIGEL